MIRGVHTMLYSSEAEELRAFLRDKFGFSFTDVGGGWLLFDLPEADMGCHPSDDTRRHGEPSGVHHLSFYCDDLETTVRELRDSGVEFVDEPEDRGYGTAIHFNVPGGFEMELYQPHYNKGS